MTGRVTTSTARPVAGLIVEARNSQGGLLRTGITDADGFYSIVSLAAGDYTVTPQKFGPTAHYLFTPANRTFNALSADQTANFTGTQVYDIQGRVTSSTVGGLGIFDVTITLSGAASATTITDANGSYILRDLLPGNYTVTPSKAGFTFDPVNRSFTNLSANQTDANFTTGSATFFTVSGHVADASNVSVSNARILMVSIPQVGNRSLLILTDASGNYSIPNLQAGGNYTFSASKALLSFTPASQTFNNLSGNQVLNFTASSVAIQATINTWKLQGRTYVYVKLSFPNAGYSVTNWGTPVRTGNDFTSDAVVVASAGASVQAVTTTAQIYDLGVVADGNYTFTFNNSGTVLKTQAFTVSSTTPPANPIDDARQFVKQQYRDFLNREADPAGEDFWTDNITKCNDPARRPAGQTVEQCTLRQRETTSGAFFLSPEFQYTGYYVYRVYVGALGRRPKLSEFIPDAQFVGNGIVVNGQLSAAVINQNKAAFAAQFVNCVDPAKYRCAEFKSIYDSLNNQQYVDRLFLTTGVNASTTERTALVNGLNGGTETRATVLQKVVDGINVISEGNQQFTTTYGQAFYNMEFNRAFVQLEYFGYMKRDPDDAGYAFWLSKLNQFGGNFVNAEMVLAFISSPEYRARFGQP
jgi:protocatechuate 3,4-dioxygenase beta subunit